MDYVKIKNLDFSYESKTIFKNINLTFKSGRQYVLVD